MHSKRFLEGSFSSSLQTAIGVDNWGIDASISGALNPTNLLLSHKDLLISEVLAVTSRLTWLAFTPNSWETLNGAQRIDEILQIIGSTTTLNRSKAVEVAHTLNKILSNYQESRSRKRLAQIELSDLLGKANRRCYLCGRAFSNDQVLKFLDRQPYKALPDRTLIDKWKPIYQMDKGWCIDIDHCLPISGAGSDDVDNYNLACHYCNNVKRNWVSIFDIGLATLSDDKLNKWKFHALRLISNCQCYECGDSVKKSELTVACHSEKALPTIQNFFVTCYKHDPQSKNRFSQ